MTSGPARVAVIGGGILGLTLALRLAQAGHRPFIVERAREPGGLASSDQIGGYTWDRFYHVVLLSDLALRALLDELGLTGAIQWGYTRSGFFAGDRVHPLSTSVDFLRFPMLGPVAKARLAATILRAARIRDWSPLEREPAADWLLRWSGREAYERFWLPMLRSKLGANHRIASAAFIWAIIARLYAARRTGLKREMFGYVNGGYAAILGRLRGALATREVPIHCGVAVREVRSTGDGAAVHLADGETLEADHAVLTMAAPAISALCPGLRPEEHERLRTVVYQGIICPSLLLRRPLAGHYVTAIADEEVPFTAVIEMTALVDRARFGGHTLVYLPRYTTADDPAWQWPDADVLERFLPALGRIYPDVRRDDLVASRVSRAREVLAVATLDYSRRLVPPLDTSLPHVYVVSSAQIVAGTLNVNETVTLANTGSEQLARRFGRHEAIAAAIPA